ncbi:MAG TPA: ATP-binding protein, partial [Myxococcales bacterium]|nr:ATP-binding protein [Myxococcales bacterium]
DLIRSAQGELARAIDGALAEMGQALSADRALIATRDANGNVVRYAWKRNGTNGRRSTSDGDPLDLVLGGLQLEDTLVCDNRKRLPVALRGAKQLKISSAILVPLNGGKTEGVLALAAKSPRSWRPDAVAATERLADLLSAGLERMATQSSLGKEQAKRVHAEAETLKLRDQLAHAGRVSMLGELAASLAHELNQPLTAIYTNAQAAQRFLDRSRPDLSEALNALHDLGQDCRRAGDVLGRLRQMFRRHETERVPLGAGVLVEHVLMLLHEDAVARGVEIKLDVEPDLPLVRGDRVQLEQVLMNLLVNAFEAVAGIPSGPKQVTVRAYARDGFVEVAVLDSGKGIARNELERIFEPFFTRKPNGMGMGLAICRTIVEAHGGRISADNRSERGAVFELSLPALPAADQSEGVES